MSGRASWGSTTVTSSQCLTRAIVPRNGRSRPREYWAQFLEPEAAPGVSYSGTRACRMPPRIDLRLRLPEIAIPERIEMVITAAHVPAIVALIAGILILIMPRLLNFIVAIYLIFVGLVGLGLLHWLHM
jgi:hypothetical protein